MNKKVLFYSLIASLSLLTLLSAALAEEKYPAREIEVVNPSPPGGFVDISLRLMTDTLSKNLGVPIVLNNREGGAGATGTNFVVKSKPDGYTLGSIPSGTLVVLTATNHNVAFKYSDLDPLCKYTSDVTVVFTKGDAPWKTLEELVTDAKKRPMQITYGATSVSISHLLMEGFLKKAKIKIKHIPLKNANETIVRVLGGNLSVGVSSLGPLSGQLKAGTVRALFLTSSDRSPLFPEIPTLKEKGYGNPVITLYTGFFAPLGLPKPVRETLTKALEKTIKDPALKKKMANNPIVTDYTSGEIFAEEIANDYKQVSEIFKTLGP